MTACDANLCKNVCPKAIKFSKVVAQTHINFRPNVIEKVFPVFLSLSLQVNESREAAEEDVTPD